MKVGQFMITIAKSATVSRGFIGIKDAVTTTIKQKCHRFARFHRCIKNGQSTICIHGGSRLNPFTIIAVAIRLQLLVHWYFYAVVQYLWTGMELSRQYGAQQLVVQRVFGAIGQSLCICYGVVWLFSIWIVSQPLNNVVAFLQQWGLCQFWR